MATITLTINDAVLARVRDGLCGYAGLESTNANAKAALIQLAKRAVRNYEQALVAVNDETAIDIT